MNARHALAAVLISALAASPAAATVLSASGQAVGTKSSKADYLRVTEVQKELNATMEDMSDAAVASGPLAASAPSSDGPGYILQKEGEGGRHRDDGEPFTQSYDDGLDDGRLAGPVTTRGQSPGNYSDNRRTMENSRRGGGNGRHGGGAHAAPEPSTWMLLGVGLALFGGYATLRRRAVVES